MLQAPILRYCGKGGLKIFEYVQCPIQNKPRRKKSNSTLILPIDFQIQKILTNIHLGINNQNIYSLYLKQFTLSAKGVCVIM